MAILSPSSASCFVLVAGVLAGSVSHGADDVSTARLEAKQLSDAGATAESSGDYASALDAFQRAYARYPSPNLLFNIGIVEERVGCVSQAVAAFEQFLDEAPNAPADARAFAATRLRELEPQIARLALTVSPAAALVRVDGRRVPLPRARAFPVMPGDHVVEALYDGREPARSRVSVVAGEQRALELELPAPPPAAPVAVAPRSAPRPALTASPPRPLSRRPWFWATLAAGSGVVAAGITLGIVFGTRARYPAPSIVGLEGN